MPLLSTRGSGGEKKKKTRKITVALLGHCHSCREGDVPEQEKVYAAWGRETFP